MKENQSVAMFGFISKIKMEVDGLPRYTQNWK